MSRLRVSKSAVIDAPPEKVYKVLADYRNHHPHILPAQYFADLVIEEGGQGAGTVFRLKVKAMGREIPYHMVVSEPEPGRVLRETDKNTGLATTFTVRPVVDGGSQVEIATEWATASGLAGFFERLGTPPVMERIYKTELEQLKAYVKRLS